MPRPGQRSRSKRRVRVRTPGGRAAVHYKHRRRRPTRCAWCGGVLGGTPRGGYSKYSKSERTVERPYGGYLCHRCLERGIKHSVLSEWGS